MSTNTLVDDATLRERNLAVARAWMTTLSQPAWWDLMHDDIVFEFPYGPSLGIPDRFVGKAAVTNYAKDLFARIGVFNFLDLTTIGTTDPSLFFSEYRAEMKTPHGESYTQIYINKLRIQDGKVILMREFWDPKRVIDSLNGTFSVNA